MKSIFDMIIIKLSAPMSHVTAALRLLAVFAAIHYVSAAASLAAGMKGLLFIIICGVVVMVFVLLLLLL
jgi:hypothetical protein